MIFLTINDEPGGVYKSQVIEVTQYLNSLAVKPVKLVSFVSWRNYRKNRKQIRHWLPGSVVLPMFPGIQFWKLNVVILFFVRGIRRDTIIARNPMAFWVAYRLNKRTIYDGRGAVGCELKEYPDIIKKPKIVQSISDAERKAVLQSIHRIAVSEKLVEHWRNEFKYDDFAHVVIPCTITPKEITVEKVILDKRRQLGFDTNTILLIYSGGVSGWQSFQLLSNVLENLMTDPLVRIIFLSPPSSLLENIAMRFPGRTLQQWIKPEDVHGFLCIADYGLLIREKNQTNGTASPVKFGEYLNAGLKVILSKNIGDFSDLVTSHNLGHIYANDHIKLSPLTFEERQRLNEFADLHLSKNAYQSAYRKLRLLS